RLSYPLARLRPRRACLCFTEQSHRLPFSNASQQACGYACVRAADFVALYLEFCSAGRASAKSASTPSLRRPLLSHFGHEQRDGVSRRRRALFLGGIATHADGTQAPRE